MADKNEIRLTPVDQVLFDADSTADLSGLDPMSALRRLEASRLDVELQGAPFGDLYSGLGYVPGIVSWFARRRVWGIVARQIDVECDPEHSQGDIE